MQYELKTKDQDNYLDDWEDIPAQDCVFESLALAQKHLRNIANALTGLIEYRLNEKGACGGIYIGPDDRQKRLEELRERPRPEIGAVSTVAFVRNASSAFDDFLIYRAEDDGMLSVDNMIDLFEEDEQAVDTFDETFVIAVKRAYVDGIDYLIFLP